MKTLITAVLAAAFAATAAVAADAPTAASSPATAKASTPREVFICDRTDVTKRSFEREFGSQTFVTAEQALKAAREQEAWSAPRCMTTAEFAKFEAALATREDTRLVSARLER